MPNLKLLAFLPLVLLIGCTVTGPADDGYENQNEWVDNGRLFDDDTKTIYSSEKRSEKSVAKAETGTISNAEMNVSSYQQWLDAKENNNAEYQKFLEWQEFEAFHRWKQEQKSN